MSFNPIMNPPISDTITFPPIMIFSFSKIRIISDFNSNSDFFHAVLSFILLCCKPVFQNIVYSPKKPPFAQPAY